ncbi:hypothetical protein NJB1907E78_14480, partial [Mycobacterium marinum]
MTAAPAWTATPAAMARAADSRPGRWAPAADRAPELARAAVPALGQVPG